MNAIEVRGISQSFLQKEVLNNISFEIQKGEIFGLLGPSGAGKTTLINIIIGQIKPCLLYTSFQLFTFQYG